MWMVDQLRVKTTTESGYVRVGNFDDLTQNDLWAFWGSQLSVNGKATIKNLRAEKISAGEITVKTQWWADFVFDDDYDLMSLDKVEDYISKNGHLPDVPSEGEVKKDGISIARSQAILLQKVEELTLHLIEQNKRLEEQNEKLARMDNIVSKQARRIESLKNRGASSDK